MRKNEYLYFGLFFILMGIIFSINFVVYDYHGRYFQTMIILLYDRFIILTPFFIIVIGHYCLICVIMIIGVFVIIRESEPLFNIGIVLIAVDLILFFAEVLDVLNRKLFPPVPC